MKRIFKFIFIFAVMSLCYASSVYAAEVVLDSASPNIQTGDEFEVGFFLSTSGEYINAVEGKVVFPDKLLEMKEIRDGNSIVNFWVERPKHGNGEISFSGIVPGGYIGQRGLVFSIIFKSLKDGQGAIEIKNIRALRNDGKGTLDNTKISDWPFAVSEQGLSFPAKTVQEKDIFAPEEFKPALGRDPAVFDGESFLVFAAQDKGSGIERYEVKEGYWGNFVSAASPYPLSNQKLDQKIFVRAVDKSGNERTEIFYPPHWRPWYNNYWIDVIILAGCVAVGFILRKNIWQKFIKSR